MEAGRIRSSYFAEQSYMYSRDIMGTVMSNLDKCLVSRNQSFKDFLNWAHSQGLPEAKKARYRRYPTKASVEKRLNTDQLAAIVLIAQYMERPVQDVMFGKYVPK